VQRTVLAATGLVVLVVALYAPVFGHEFLSFDDDTYVTENHRVRRGLSVESARWALTATHASNWHPLTWLSHMLDFELHGLDPAGHHGTSVLLHGLNAALLLVALYMMTGRLGPSLAVALLFAVHPLRVESVAWVAERKDVLSGLFWMLTLVAYAFYARRPGPARYALVCLTFALGLLSKPMLVTLPFVLLLLDVWPLARRLTGRLILEKLPLLLLAAASAAVTVAAQAGGGAMHASEAWPLGARLSNALVSYVAYLWSTVLPTGLACFYPHPFALDSDGTLLRATGAALLLAAATGGALVAWRRRPYLAVGWFWYVGTLVPVIGLVQVGAQARADRYTYLPLIGIYVAAAWAVAELIERKPTLRAPALAAAAAVLLALAVTTRTQIGYWKNGRTLFGHAVRVTTGNYIAHNNLGSEFEARGEYDEAERQFRQALHARGDFPPALNNLGLILTRRGELDGAIEDFSRALELDPGYAEAHNNLGAALQRQGRLAGALTHFEEAVRLDPGHAEAHNNLGVIFEARRDLTRAAMHYERALTLDPDMAEAQSNLGNVLLARGDLGRAQARYEAALVANPDFPEAHNNLGFVLAQKGDLAGAASHYRRAVELRPELWQAAGSLAWILATSPDPSLRSASEARVYAERCAAGAGRDDVLCLEALAAAHAELGDFEQAVRWQTLAVPRAAAGGRSAPRARLELYRLGRPYRSADQ